MTSLYRQARFFIQWQSNPTDALDEFIHKIRGKNLFKPDIFDSVEGEILFSEGQRARHLYILLRGCVKLYKTEDGVPVQVTDIEPGGIFGVMSFFSNRLTLTQAVVEKPSRIFRLNRHEVELILSDDSSLSVMGRQMLTANLMDRYAQVVDLNVRMNTINHELDQEHTRLMEAMQELKSAHNRLVHQEKMATLGQLVAGVAHEINNPAAALENAVTYMTELLPSLFSEEQKGKTELGRMFFGWGLDSAKIQTAKNRDLERSLKAEFADLKSSEIRKLVLLSDEAIAQCRKLYRKGKISELRTGLNYMEAGMQLRLIRITSGRIAGLVQSLKRYSRQGSSQVESINMFEGLSDSLHVLGNRLKGMELDMQVDPELPPVKADPAELNQVWTNIIVNACDILNDTGKIYIRSEISARYVTIRIGDNGPGVPLDLREKIFKPSFTTRNSSGNYGLGLGLSISRELVMKHGGTLEVGESTLGGAEFAVTLPRYELTSNRILAELGVH